MKWIAGLFLAGMLGSGACGAEVAAKKPTMAFKFEDVTVNTVLGEISQRLGFVVVNTNQIRDRITVISPSPLDAESAISMLNSFLIPKGYAAVERANPDGSGQRFLQVLTWEEAKKLARVNEW